MTRRAFGIQRPFQYLPTLVPKDGARYSWFDIEDLRRAIHFLIENPHLSETFNLAAPERHTMNAIFADMRLHYGRPQSVHIPAWLLRLLRREAADALLKGQCALPGRLLDSGFQFQSPTLRCFLELSGARQG